MRSDPMVWTRTPWATSLSTSEESTATRLLACAARNAFWSPAASGCRSGSVTPSSRPIASVTSALRTTEISRLHVWIPFSATQPTAGPTCNTASSCSPDVPT